MLKSRRTLALLLALVMMIPFAGITNAMADVPPLEKIEENGVNVNLTGYPIVDEPITVKAAVMYGSLRPNQDVTKVWDYVAEKTGIRFEVEALKDAEKKDLMFASREFPEVMFNVAITANQLSDSAEAQDLLEMDPLIDAYAPTWAAFLKDNPIVRNASLAPDGNLYTLPYIDFAPFDRNLRDQWIIMKSWLEELNLEAPKTTDEFKTVLNAIKDAAGTGTIPAEVMPYYFLFDNYVGGQFDIYSSYGVPVTSDGYLVVEGGVVKDQSTNPDIKEPLKYLADLYAEGLIPPESFTDDWNTYVSRISATPAIVGTYHSYANRHMGTGGAAMGPIDSGNGKQPQIRSQAYTPGPAHTAMITASCQHPIAVTRFFEAMATDVELMLTVSRGLQGVLWDYDEAGKAYQLFWEEAPDKMAEHAMELGLHNSFIALKDSSFYENIWNEVAYEQEDSRPWAYQNIYEAVVMPNEWVYVSGALSADDTNMLNQYKTDLANYRKSMYADFITGAKDIDAEWDAFTAEMERLGLAQFVELSQKAYDAIAK